MSGEQHQQANSAVTHSQKVQLIALVQNHDCLYNRYSREFNDKEFKDQTWDGIAMQCGISSGLLARTTWNKLRNGFRISLKNKTKKWKYYKLMRGFMIPHIKQRHNSSIRSTENNRANPVEEVTIDGDSAEEAPDKETVISTLYIPQNRIVNSRNGPSTSNCHVMEEVERQPRCVENEVYEDKHKKFFEYVYSVTKEWSADLQLHVEKSVFELIHNIRQGITE